MTESQLSNDLKVACEIYHLTEVKKERVWFTKLVDVLKDKMSKNEVSHALDTLWLDWGIVESEYGETENGRCGRLFYIDDERHGDRIKKVYEEHYGK